MMTAPSVTTTLSRLTIVCVLMSCALQAFAQDKEIEERDDQPKAGYTIVKESVENVTFEEQVGQREASEQGERRMVITNPTQTHGTVHFLFSKAHVTLKPGEQISVLVGAHQPIVRFHRGGDFGYANYQLMGLQYKFQVNRKQGWELERLDPDEVAINEPAEDQSTTE